MRTLLLQNYPNSSLQGAISLKLKGEEKQGKRKQAALNCQFAGDSSHSLEKVIKSIKSI